VVMGDGAPPDGTAIPARDAITLRVLAETVSAAHGSATKASTTDSNPPPGSCVATDPTAWNAYAVIADLPLDEAGGSNFLVDPDGWLRVAQRPGVTSGWRSRDDLLAAIRGIRAHPIKQSNGGSHEHHH
jgi:hypothetical protein